MLYIHGRPPLGTFAQIVREFTGPILQPETPLMQKTSTRAGLAAVVLAIIIVIALLVRRRHKH